MPDFMNIACYFMNQAPYLFMRPNREARMATLQVKGMDDDLYRALAARAVQERRSISQQVTRIIQDFLSKRRGSAEETTTALLELCGSWVDDRPAEEIAEDIRRARKSGGRSIDVLD